MSYGKVVIGRLALSGWEGITFTDVEVTGETQKKYRIRAIKDTRLAGRCRTLKAGDSTLVPKYAVRDKCETCNGEKGGVPGNENIEHGRLICDYCHAAR
jgi:hypothetical protein